MAFTYTLSHFPHSLITCTRPMIQMRKIEEYACHFLNSYSNKEHS